MSLSQGFKGLLPRGRERTEEATSMVDIDPGTTLLLDGPNGLPPPLSIPVDLTLFVNKAGEQ